MEVLPIQFANLFTPALRARPDVGVRLQKHYDERVCSTPNIGPTTRNLADRVSAGSASLSIIVRLACLSAAQWPRTLPSLPNSSVVGDGITWHEGCAYRVSDGPQLMLHSQSLKTIGRALEAAKITTFKVDVKSELYRVFVGEVMFPFDAAALSRVSALVQTNDPNSFARAKRVRASLAAQLRAVGDYADRMEVDEFRIVWSQDFAILDYEQADAKLSHRVFTAEELQKLALHPPLPRSVSYFPPRLGYWS